MLPTCVSSKSPCSTPATTTTRASTTDLDAVIEAYTARGDNGGIVVALVLAMAIAHMRGDVARLLTVDEVAQSLPHADDVPALRFLRGAMRATKASLEGDATRRGGSHRGDRPPAAGHRRSTSSCSASTPTCCACVGGQTRQSRSLPRRSTHRAPYVRTLHPKVRWLAGDPGGFPGGQFDVDVPPGTNARYHLYHAYYGMAVITSFGRSDLVDGLSATVEKAASDRRARRHDAGLLPAPCGTSPHTTKRRRRR